MTDAPSPAVASTPQFDRGRVLLVIPAYNEEPAIGATLDACLRVVHRDDILVVDDGSRDGTSQVARDKGVTCLRLPINLGIGGAVQTGYLYAHQNGYRVAVQLDADGQHDPTELEKIIGPVLRDECDLAIGSRFLELRTFRSSFARRLGIRTLSTAIWLSTGTRVRDVTSGFRAAGPRAIELFARYYPADYPEPESLALVLHNDLRVKEVPVAMHARVAGRSSIRPLDSLVYMAKVLGVLAAYGAFARSGAKEGTR